MKFLRYLSCLTLFSALVFCFIFPKSLVSYAANDFQGFTLKEQHAGQATFLYYPKLDPTAHFHKKVTVGLIDSGVAKKTAGQLAGVKSFDATTQNDPFDTLGHGTKVASIIAAKDDQRLMLGIAPKATLYSYKVVDQAGLVKNAYLERALTQALKDQVDLLNLSLLPKQLTPKVKELLVTYQRQGGLIFASAYTLKDPTTLSLFSKLKGVLLVGTYDQYFQPLGQNKAIAFYAPLTQIALTKEQQLVYVEGTSFGTAFVTGAAANYFALGKTRAEVFAMLQKFFSASALTKQQTFSSKFFAKHISSLEVLYTCLALATLFLFILLGLLSCFLHFKRQQSYWKLLVAEMFLLGLVAFLLLPTKM